MSSDSDSDNDQGEQVRVSLKLAPTVQDRSLEVPTEPIAVPADIGRTGLSAVVNHLLGRKVSKTTTTDDDSDSDSDDDDDEERLASINFEFILFGNNKLLRKGVEKEARQHGLSLEKEIPITYFPATNAPELTDEKEKLPDWIASLSCSESMICSGCYDGSLHIYRMENDTLSESFSTMSSSSPVKCIEATTIEDDLWIASSCLDHTLRIHTISKTSQIELYGQCIEEGISCAISSLDFASSSSTSKVLASGDGNGTVRIWDLQNTIDSSEPAKRVKTENGNKSGNKNIRSIPPQVTLDSAHTQLVSGVSWGNHGVDNFTHLITGSWDHSLKLWDVERQDCLLTLNGSRVVSCLDTSYHSDGVVATGHPDCTIRLWDVRANATTKSSLVSDNSFRPSHKAWVSSVQWSKHNPYQLASTSHDGTVKIWDIRSSIPLHTIRAFPKEEKGLCLIWNRRQNDMDDGETTKAEEDVIFAGGTDCIIKQLKL